MPDEYGDKTEAPTPKRRQEAREQGNIPKSQDLTAAILILAVITLLDWFGPRLFTALRDTLMDTLSVGVLADHNPGNLTSLVLHAVIGVSFAMTPVLLGLALLAVICNVGQVGLVLAPKRLKPKASSINPIKGIQKLFGKAHALIQLGMNLLKLLVVIAVAYSAIHGRIEEILFSQQLTFLQVFLLAGELVYGIVLRVGIALLLIAIIDYFYQRYRVEQSLKMTKQQVKDEMRRMEGDPMIKARRREIARQRIIQRFQRDVPSADVVVTNPTHFAIAIRYDESSMHAPKVVAKGQDYLAMKIREIAGLHGVPILERPPLARALYKLCEVGQEIPEKFYGAVAEILAYVYELTGRIRRGQPAAASV
jgi:flagellar biosynthetic protein FlhB